MSRGKKNLPKPPVRPFQRKRQSEGSTDAAPLMADEMAAAMAEGKLEEYLKREMPDNEYARKLSEMMMGMTGLLPPECGHPASPPHPPDDVMKAAESGDVKGLMGLLQREQGKRAPVTDQVTGEEKPEDSAPAFTPAEKETAEALMKIASENSVSVDWIVLRALRFYIRQYKESGRL